MTALNFLLSRAFARTLRRATRSWSPLSTTTRTSPRGSSSRTTSGVVVHVAGLTPDLELDHEDLEAKVSDRTRVVAFPVAANSVGTAPDVRRLVALAHSVGALAWADAVHYAPHGPIDVAGWDVDVLICSPYKFFGRTWGSRSGSASCSSRGVPTRCGRPRTSPSGTASSSGRASTSCSPGSSRPSTTWPRSAGTRCSRTSGPSGSGSSRDFRTASTCTAFVAMEGRVPTFCFNVHGRTAEEVAFLLAEREIAVWHGDYYAVETMSHLGLQDGAVRAGIVHYNTEDEVDRLLAGLAEIA